MAIEIMSRKILRAVEADLATGTKTIDVEIKLTRGLGLSPDQADRYVRIARAKTLDEHKGKDARLFGALGVKFKKFMNRG